MMIYRKVFCYLVTYFLLQNCSLLKDQVCLLLLTELLFIRYLSKEDIAEAYQSNRAALLSHSLNYSVVYLVQLEYSAV